MTFKINLKKIKKISVDNYFYFIFFKLPWRIIIDELTSFSRYWNSSNEFIPPSARNLPLPKCKSLITNLIFLIGLSSLGKLFLIIIRTLIKITPLFYCGRLWGHSPLNWSALVGVLWLCDEIVPDLPQSLIHLGSFPSIAAQLMVELIHLPL